MKTIAIQDAQPGMMITRVTQQNGPVKIQKSGLITSQTMIQGLIEMGVQEIEYDPDQTVEICLDDEQQVVSTPTQALLRGQFDSQARKADAAINEQFNRSLFLPTVNGLPAWWQRALKPVALYGLLGFGGLACGFVLAKLPVWYETIVSPAPIAQQPVAMPVPETTTGQQTSTPQQTSLNDSPVAQTEPEQTEKSEAIAQGEYTAATLPGPAAESIASESVVDENIINADPDDNVSVSPELMARFNKVLSDLEKEDSGEEPVPTQPKVTVHDDIKRIDQLPARLLTRLPTMDFSAHMYATVPRDRWVRVNGQDKTEGDWIDDRVQIVNIEAQRVVLRFEGEVFAMTALTDW